MPSSTGAFPDYWKSSYLIPIHKWVSQTKCICIISHSKTVRVLIAEKLFSCVKQFTITEQHVSLMVDLFLEFFTKSLGISDPLLSWLDGKQFVKTSDTASIAVINFFSGVPQGPHIGPIFT